MAIRRDFAHILQEKMDFPLEEKANVTQKTKKYVPIYDHSVSFYTNPYSWTPRKTSPFYKKKELKKPHFSPEKEAPQNITPPIKEKSFSLTTFNESEKKSFNTLLSLGAKLDEKCFSLKQLKREYRILAKIHHPDRSKSKVSSSLFQELHDAHLKLCKKITALSSKEI